MRLLKSWLWGIPVIALAACQPEPTPLPVAFPTQAQAAIVLTDALPERTASEDRALQAYTLAVIIREEDEALAMWLRDALNPAGFAASLSTIVGVTPPVFERASSDEQLRDQLANLGYPDGLVITVARMGETPGWVELGMFYGDVPVSLQPDDVERATLVFVGWRGDTLPTDAPTRDETWVDLLRSVPPTSE